jgi:hypothetical protein
MANDGEGGKSMDKQARFSKIFFPGIQNFQRQIALNDEFFLLKKEKDKSLVNIFFFSLNSNEAMYNPFNELN